MKEIYKGIGKRKTSIAKAFLEKGSGSIKINGKEFLDFFKSNLGDEEKIKTPLILINLPKSYDINILVQGGGISARVEAIRLAISKALCKLDISYRKKLKASFFLNRDSRIKERRKYGLRKARKAPQYSKR
jgi:small subunit ribosomal protein S9